RPPRPPLFPYTTLFRSLLQQHRESLLKHLKEKEAEPRRPEINDGHGEEPVDEAVATGAPGLTAVHEAGGQAIRPAAPVMLLESRSEEHTSELQSRENLV